MTDRPPLTPVTSRLTRSNSRGSLGSTSSTGRRPQQQQQQKFNTWNPRSNTRKSLQHQLASRTLKLERTSSGRSSICSDGSKASSTSKRKGPSVCVMVRIRPSTTTTTTKDSLQVVEMEDSDVEEPEDGDWSKVSTSKMKQASIHLSGQVFAFDRVFQTNESQDVVFRDAGRPIAESALQGFNASIFAYGQTGSGKTYTMQGDTDDQQARGLIPRVLEYCFAGLEKLKRDGATILAHCSFLEIYNEQVFDLLEHITKEQASAPGYTQAAKSVREDMKRGVFVENAVEEPIETVEEAFQYIKKGAAQRHVSATNMNRESSRSHSIFTISIEIKYPADESKGTLETTKTAKINLVDLAGSERQRATKTTGDRLTEAKHINKSLSALGNVISALVERSKGRVQHVPHRDSVLTYLLRDSLGGNTKTSIIATVSPDAVNFQDTLSTLQFGQRAKHIRNFVKANMTLSTDPVALQKQIRRLQGELHDKEKLIASLVIQIPNQPQLFKTGELEDQEEQLILESADPLLNPEQGPNLALVGNADFTRLEHLVLKATNEKKKSDTTHTSSQENGQLVLRKRITHLERVLVTLLQELGENRKVIKNLREEMQHRKDLEQTLRDNLATKELLNHLNAQQIKDLESNNIEALRLNNELRKEAEATDEELVLQGEIAQLRAENASLAQFYRQAQENRTESLHQKLLTLQVQLEAVLDDKSELERLVKEFEEENLRLKKEQDQALEEASSENKTVYDEKEEAKTLIGVEDTSTITSVEALEKALAEARARADTLEQELFLQMERGAQIEADMESGRTEPQGDSGETKPSSEQQQQKATAKHAEQPVNAEAEQLVVKRILHQLADTRKSLKEAEREKRRLSVQLERATTSARKQKQKLRKSLSAKDADFDEEHVQNVRLELEVSSLRERFERTLCQKKELEEAASMANSVVEYKSKQLDEASKKLKDAQQEVKRKEEVIQSLRKQLASVNQNGDGEITPIGSMNENMSLSANREKSTGYFPCTPGGKKSVTGRESNQTIQMETFEQDEEDVPSKRESDEILQSSSRHNSLYSTSSSRLSIQSELSRSTSQSQIRRAVSVAEFFPSGAEGTSDASAIAKRKAELVLESQECMSQSTIRSSIGDEDLTYQDLELSFSSAVGTPVQHKIRSTGKKRTEKQQQQSGKKIGQSNSAMGKKGSFRLSNLMRFSMK